MVDYYIKVGSGAEKNIKTEYGVHVSGTTGLVGKPPFKDAKTYSWDYLNGEWTDLSTRRYKPREITMSCWIETGRQGNKAVETLAVSRLNTFLKLFDHNGNVRLRVSFNHSDDNEDNLYYLVYLSGSSYSYKWRKGVQILEFELRLVEPSPEKMVFHRGYGSAEQRHVTVTYTSTSEFEIDWGDGTVSYDLVGTNMSVDHTYSSVGNYIIIVSGVVKDISVSVPYGDEQDHEEEER